MGEPLPDEFGSEDYVSRLREPGDPAPERAQRQARALASLAVAAATSGRQRAMRAARMTEQPEPGALVVMLDVERVPPIVDGVGRVLGSWSFLGEWWTEHDAAYPIVGQYVVMIETLDGRAVKWSNCTPIVIAENHGEDPP